MQNNYYAHFDASVRGKMYLISYVILNKEKDIIAEHTEWFMNDNLSNKDSDSSMAEFLALNSLLKKAIELNIEEIHIFGDCKSVIHGCMNKCKVKMRYRPIYDEIKELKSKLKKCNLQFVKRKRNKIADALCREAYKQASKFA